MYLDLKLEAQLVFSKNVFRFQSALLPDVNSSRSATTTGSKRTPNPQWNTWMKWDALFGTVGSVLPANAGICNVCDSWVHREILAALR